MQKRFIYLFVFFVIILIGSVSFIASRTLFIPAKTHYHAGFIVFKNNKKLDFSDNKYMFFEPCTVSKKNDDSAEDIQIEKAHLHENVGDLVHVERTGPQWKDLFTNIHYSLDYANATGYINGKKVTHFQLQPIQPYASLVVFIGKNDTRLLSQAVTKSYIEKMAKKSTTCGD